MKRYNKSMKHRIIALFLIAVLWVGMIQTSSTVQASNVGKLLYFTGDLNIRTGPGKTYNLIGVAKRGSTGTILGEQMTDKIWYQVRVVNDKGVTVEGWVSSMFSIVLEDSSGIATSGDAVSGALVADYMAAGFPESYATRLALLSVQHPTWKFVPVDTGLSWGDVIANESIVGRNLVENSDDDSHKSTQAGAYDWYTNTWAIYDGNRWVAASPDYIAYRMDPRNYLDDVYVFMFESLSYDENQTLDGVSSILSSTFMRNSVLDTDGTTLDYAQTFYDIGKSQGVSPYHLASRVVQEQGAGTSDLISGTNASYPGYFNYFNIGAFNSSAGTAVQNGLAKAKAMGWNTRRKSIEGGSSLISESYIKKGQDTLYFQKFNVVNHNALYSHQYMTNVSAARSEARKVAAGYADKNQAFVFRIPIYKDMPAEPVAFSDSGNPNNFLKSLNVSGIALTPSFNGATTSYSAVVGESVSSVNVSSAAVASTSSVRGNGNYNLSPGSNIIKVTCKAQNGTEKTYTINVYRQGDGAGTDNSDIQSDTYKVSDVITGINPETSVGDMLSKVNVAGSECKVLNADGSENTGAVATGNKLAVYNNGALVKTVDIVIFGDVNGDGKIALKDLFELNRHLLGIRKLEGVYEKAGDINQKKDGISLSDLFLLNRHILNISSISQ